MDKKELIVKCEDNCSCISFDKWLDEEDYYVTFYKSYQGSSFLSKIKDMWKILRGKNVIGFEVILKEDDFTKIRNF